MSFGTSSGLNSERDLASIPMTRAGVARLIVARLKSAGVPVAPLLKRVGLTPELIASTPNVSVRAKEFRRRIDENSPYSDNDEA